MLFVERNDIMTKKKISLGLLLMLLLSIFLTGCGGEKIEPLENEINLVDLAQGGVADASFTAENIHQAGDGTVIDLTVYNYELFDAVEASKLKKGDIIVADGKEIKVSTVTEKDGILIINGGAENGGINLQGGEGGTYYEITADEAKVFYKVGTVSVPVSKDVAIQDFSDPLLSTYTAYDTGDLPALAADEHGFKPNNTTVVIENGEISRINRIFIP